MRRVSEATGLPSASAVATGMSPPPSFPVRPGFTARLRQHSYGGSSSGLHGLHGHGGSSSGMRLCMQLAAICGCLLLGFQISRQASLALVGQKGSSKKIGLDVDQSEKLRQGSGTNTRFNLFGLSDWLESSTEFSQVLKAQELAATAAGRPWKSGKRRMTLVVTPTFARTFQAMYLGGLGASLRLVPGPLLWIVVEAGGKTAETEEILRGSGVRFKHLASGDRQPNPLDWSDRSEMEVRLRIRALLHIRRARLDGVVVFCDESNVHSLTFFEEAQNVEWFGAASVGFLVQDGYVDAFASEVDGRSPVPKNRRRAKQRSHFKRLPLQAPVCANNSTRIVGWHVFPHRPSDLDSMGPPIREAEEAGSLEWGGFVVNARLLWDEDLVAKRPGWVRAWQEWSGEIVGEEDLLGEWQSAGGADILTRMLRDDGHVEPLGRCGWRTLLWWMHAEARFSSLYPPMWNLGETPVLPEVEAAQEMLKGKENGEGTVAEETARGGEAGDPSQGDTAEKPQQGLIPQNRRNMARMDVLGDHISLWSSTTKMAGESEPVMELEEESFITATGEKEELELSEERR